LLNPTARIRRAVLSRSTLTSQQATRLVDNPAGTVPLAQGHFTGKEETNMNTNRTIVDAVAFTASAVNLSEVETMEESFAASPSSCSGGSCNEKLAD